MGRDACVRRVCLCVYFLSPDLPAVVKLLHTLLEKNRNTAHVEDDASNLKTEEDVLLADAEVKVSISVSSLIKNALMSNLPPYFKDLLHQGLHSCSYLHPSSSIECAPLGRLRSVHNHLSPVAFYSDCHDHHCPHQ